MSLLSKAYDIRFFWFGEKSYSRLMVASFPLIAQQIVFVKASIAIGSIIKEICY